jgi:peptidoglycan hydrolase CwlO-like protein
MAKSQATKTALLEQSLATMANQIARLATQITDGFEGVHKRQDVTNGRISKGETEIALLKKEIENSKQLAAEQMRNRVRVWQVISVLGPIIAALASYIVQNL